MLGTSGMAVCSLEEVHRFPNGPVETRLGLCWKAPPFIFELKTGLRLAADRKLPIKSISCDTWGLDCFSLDESSNGAHILLPRQS